MLIASVQMSVVEGDKAKTIEKAVENIRRAKGADLILLPEIWNIGFMSFDRYLPDAEGRDGLTLDTLRQAAREVGAHLHTGSFVEEDNGKYYNSSYLISPQGEILDNYRKIHLFGYDSRETQLLTPGRRIVVVDTPLGKLGMVTCYDLRFPELFRRMIEQGVELILVCSAWPYPRLEHWIILNRARALENQCFLASANSVGLNRGVTFVGHSMIVDPWGIILAGGGDDDVILKSDVDLAEVESARKRFPAVADRQEWVSRKG